MRRRINRDGDQMKKFFLSILLFLAFSASGFCYDLEKLLKESPGQLNYPSANVLVLKDKITYQIKEDDKRILTEHEAVKVLTEDGINRFQNIEYNYNPDIQDVTVEVARIITPNGQIIEVSEKDITDITPLKNFSLFSNITTKSIQFPKLTPGVIIEYKVVILDKSGFMPYQFWGASYVQDYEPILESVLVVEAPRAWKLNYKAYGDSIPDPEIKIENNKKIYTWSLSNSPPIPREASSPTLANLASQIIISSLNSWGQFADWYKTLIAPSVIPSSEVNNKIKEIIKDKDSKERAKKIYSFIQENIRYFDLGWGQFGYLPHTSGDVYRNKYGDSQDIMVLALSMFNAAGVPAYPVLICSLDNRNINKDFPYPRQIDHCFVMIENDGRQIFLDPTSRVASFGSLAPEFQGRDAILLKETGIEIVRTPQSKSYQNREEISIEAVLDEDGKLNQSVEIKEHGSNAMAFRKFLWNKGSFLQEKAVKIIAEMISDKARVIEGFITNLERLEEPLVVTFSFICPDYAQVESYALYFKLPVFTSSRILDLVKEDYRERIFPVQVGAPAQIDKKMHIKFPFKVDPIGLPVPVLIENNAGSYQLIYEVKDRELWYYTRLIIKDEVISKDKYKEFKELIEAAFQVEKDVIYLKRAL